MLLLISIEQGMTMGMQRSIITIKSVLPTLSSNDTALYARIQTSRYIYQHEGHVDALYSGIYGRANPSQGQSAHSKTLYVHGNETLICPTCHLMLEPSAECMNEALWLTRARFDRVY